jgi:hypothetical protein
MLRWSDNCVLRGTRDPMTNEYRFSLDAVDELRRQIEETARKFEEEASQ